MSDDERELERVRRVGLNEALFRELNEQLRDLADEFRARGDGLDLVCECGNADCDERIQLSRGAYEQLRSDARLFAVVPGHEKPDVEDVVERRRAYHVVRKHGGEPARLAAATDPRPD